MGKKHRRDKAGARKINVEIAPGNQAAMGRYIESYNHRENRTTPKIGYTDLVNEALDRFLRAAAARGRHGRKENGK
jgi:hypothetical protein